MYRGRPGRDWRWCRHGTGSDSRALTPEQSASKPGCRRAASCRSMREWLRPKRAASMGSSRSLGHAQRVIMTSKGLLIMFLTLGSEMQLAITESHTCPRWCRLESFLKLLGLDEILVGLASGSKAGAALSMTERSPSCCWTCSNWETRDHLACQCIDALVHGCPHRCCPRQPRTLERAKANTEARESSLTSFRSSQQRQMFKFRYSRLAI